MRKKISGLIALALALCLLCGCSSLGNQAGSFRNATGAEMRGLESGPELKYEEIEYKRPDLNLLRSYVAGLELALGEGSLRNAMRLLDKCYLEYYNFHTMYNLANIRSCQDVTDAYYAGEYAWCDDNYAVLRQLMEDMFYLCGSSALAGELELQYFWEGFALSYENAEEAVFSAALLELMHRESVLLAEYRSIAASPTINMADGTEVDYYSYIQELYDEERYSEAMLQYYSKYNEELSRIYIELVKVRRQLAEELGFENYEQMQYYYYFERDYSPEQAAEYLSDIKEHVVPFYRQVIATDPYASISYDRLSDQRLFEILQSAAAKIGGQVEEAFSFMAEGGFYDIRLDSNKAEMSFQTYLSDYGAPFLFLNRYGDVEDILSFSHEFGHYVDAYVNYDAYETIDLSECFSQGMEYLMLSHFDEALSEKELDNLYRIKMMDTLELYVQQASFAEFERIVYSTDPERLSAEMLNQLSLRLAEEYGYYSGENREYFAYSWTDISHYFEMPFYVISYPVSNDIAMQIYELEQQQEGLGLEKYLEILPREYQGLMDTISAGGLSSPFEPGRIEKVVQDMSAHLSWSERAA